MKNQGYIRQHNEVGDPQDNEKPGREPGDPKMNRAVLPPINVPPTEPQTQPTTESTMMAKQPKYPVQPGMGYVPPSATYTVPPIGAQLDNFNPANSKGSRPAWAHKCALILSILLIISGVVIFIPTIAFLIAGYFQYTPLTVPGTYGGLLMIITGGIGVRASKMKTTCKIVSLMVLTIILSVLSVWLIAMHSIAILGSWVNVMNSPAYDHVYNDDMPTSSREYLYDYNCTHPYETVNNIYCDEYTAYKLYPEAKSSGYKNDYDNEHARVTGAFIFNAVSMSVGLIVFVVCIVASALTCRAVCCRSRSTVSQVVYVPASESCQMNPMQQGQIVSQGQLVQQGGNMEVISVPPHGRFQHQYTQSQEMVNSQNEIATISTQNTHTGCDDDK